MIGKLKEIVFIKPSFHKVTKEMTKEKAIEVLTHLSDYYWCDDFLSDEPYVVFDKEFKEAIDVAVKALQEQTAIVYCKDCEFRDLAGAAPFMYHYCRNDNGLSDALKEDDFCPYGAMKEI